MPTDALPFIPYGRTSRLGARDAAENISRGEQFAGVRATAKRFDLPLMEREFYDADVSGSTFERPQWEAAISLIREGKAAGIVAFDLKRISRGKTAEVLTMIEDVESVGGQLYDGSGRVSVDDADAELMTTVKAMIARREWRERKAYLAASVRNAIDRGVHLSVPFGFERSDGKGSPLAINEAEAPAVRMAFRMRADGHSWQAIAAAINATGIMPRPYKRHDVVKQAVWTHKTVRQLVVGREGDGNRVYLGVAWNGEHATEDAHPAIIDRDTFLAANEARGTKPVGPDEGHLLSGLVRCQGCGYVMTYNGRDFLRCRAAQHGDGRCPSPAGVNARQLEDLVVADFKLRLRGAVDVTGSEASEAVTEAVAQTRRLAMRHANVLSRMPDDLSGPAGENWEAAEREASAALAAAKRHENEVKAQARGANLPADLDADNFDTWPLPDRRTFLHALFAAVVVRAADRWREPVADRFGVILRDEGPTHPTALIARVAGA